MIGVDLPKEVCISAGAAAEVDALADPRVYEFFGEVCSRLKQHATEAWADHSHLVFSKMSGMHCTAAAASGSPTAGLPAAGDPLTDPLATNPTVLPDSPAEARSNSAPAPAGHDAHESRAQSAGSAGPSHVPGSSAPEPASLSPRPVRQVVLAASARVDVRFHRPRFFRSLTLFYRF